LVQPFSILERIDVGETSLRVTTSESRRQAFSILERIDVGETFGGAATITLVDALSVSSNGSTWVKPPPAPSL